MRFDNRRERPVDATHKRKRKNLHLYGIPIVRDDNHSLMDQSLRGVVWPFDHEAYRRDSISMMISVFSGWLLAFEFLGYHAPGHAPDPTVSILLLVLGLAIAAVGQLFGAERNEEIRTRGCVSVIDVVHMRLTFAAIVFMGCVLKYAMAGKHIPLYPVGPLAIAGGFLLASRAITKYVFNLDHRKRAKG